MQPTGSGWPPFAGHETNTAGTSDGQDGEDEIATDRSHEFDMILPKTGKPLGNLSQPGHPPGFSFPFFPMTSVNHHPASPAAAPTKLVEPTLMRASPLAGPDHGMGREWFFQVSHPSVLSAMTPHRTENSYHFALTRCCRHPAFPLLNFCPAVRPMTLYYATFLI